MNQTTKWILIVAGILLFIGMWMTIFVFALRSNLSSSETEIMHGGSDRVGVVDLLGTILTSDETVRQLKKYREDRTIRGVLLRIDSPGGGVVASQEIYEEVRRTRASGKPVVVSMGALGASGGYYAACAANRIVANRGTLTGSIGVISEFIRFDPMLAKIGIEATTIKSGKLKDAGSPFREMTSADKEYFQGLMDDVHRQFIAAVEHERPIGHDSLVAISDGRVFTGEEAVRMRLIDTIGTFEDAVEILAALSHIHGKPTVVKERRRGDSLFERLLGESKIDDVLEMKDELLHQPLLQYKMPQGM